jgi:hypothetical protein
MSNRKSQSKAITAPYRSTFGLLVALDCCLDVGLRPLVAVGNPVVHHAISKAAGKYVPVVAAVEVAR